MAINAAAARAQKTPLAEQQSGSTVPGSKLAWRMNCLFINRGGVGKSYRGEGLGGRGLGEVENIALGGSCQDKTVL